MSQNENNPELFDHWLSDHLQSAHTAAPVFAENVVRRMERLYAQRILRKVILQERIAAGSLIVTVAAIIGLLCWPAVLRRLYICLESAFTYLIRWFIEPQAPDLYILVVILLLFGLLLRTVWKNLTSDY